MTDPVHTPAPSRRPSRLARLAVLACALMAAGVVVLLAGFIVFATGIQRREPGIGRTADGIVVLTGGAERIVDATNLLAAGHGKRLLITGVHPDTTLAEIGRTVPVPQSELDCCVDMGRSALNTRGNAIETAQWARARRFHSLIVVTSSWHMPRALVELGRAVPGVDLVPYPVVTDRMREAPWWRSLGTTRLLFLEYVKFLLAYAQIRPWPALTADASPPGP